MVFFFVMNLTLYGFRGGGCGGSTPVCELFSVRGRQAHDFSVTLGGGPGGGHELWKATSDAAASDGHGEGVCTGEPADHATGH